MQEIVTLNGVRYRRVGASTLEHDHWIAGLTRQAGAEAWSLRPGESHESLGARILGDLMASGKAFLILGGLLIPADEKLWSPAIAKRTARHLALITDQEEKRTANAELLAVVMEFFVSGLASWMTSETSSEGKDEPGPIGAARRSGNGRDSFEGSAAETSIEGGGSSGAGRSARH